MSDSNPTKTALPELPRPPRSRYTHEVPAPLIRLVASGHGGTLEVEDNSQAYLYDIAQSLRRIADALEDSRE